MEGIMNIEECEAIIKEFLINIKEEKRIDKVIDRFRCIKEEYRDRYTKDKYDLYKFCIEELWKISRHEEEERIKKMQCECAARGHKFDKWLCLPYTVITRHTEPSGRIIERKKSECSWRRTCPECGYTEYKDYVPQEVIEERKIADNEEKIKKLQREIDDIRKKKKDKNSNFYNQI